MQWHNFENQAFFDEIMHKMETDFVVHFVFATVLIIM